MAGQCGLGEDEVEVEEQAIDKAFIPPPSTGRPQESEEGPKWGRGLEGQEGEGIDLDLQHHGFYTHFLTRMQRQHQLTA
jgi:hypothetical protein